MNKLPLYPKHPERVCWGCDRYCPADDLACGNGSDRTQHPIELFGPDWVEWSQELAAASAGSSDEGRAPVQPADEATAARAGR